MTLTDVVSAGGGAAVQAAAVASRHDYPDQRFLALSYLIAVCSLMVTMNSVTRLPDRRSARKVGWTFATAIALGGGAVWSTHIIAIAGYELANHASPTPGQVMIAAVASVAVALVGTLVPLGDPGSLGRLICAGVFTGLGLTAIRFAGISAMRIPGTVEYDPELVLAAVLTACATAFVVFGLAFQARMEIQAGRVVRGFRDQFRTAGLCCFVGSALWGANHATVQAARVPTEPTGRPGAGWDPVTLAVITATGTAIALLFITIMLLGNLSGRGSTGSGRRAIRAAPAAAASAAPASTAPVRTAPASAAPARPPGPNRPAAGRPAGERPTSGRPTGRPAPNVLPAPDDTLPLVRGMRPSTPRTVSTARAAATGQTRG